MRDTPHPECGWLHQANDDFGRHDEGERGLAGGLGRVPSDGVTISCPVQNGAQALR